MARASNCVNGRKSVCGPYHSTKPVSILLLTAENPKSVSGTDIWVDVRWTNTSDHEISSNAWIQKDTNLDMTLLFDIRDDHHHPVPKRVWKFPQGTLYDAVSHTLKPGESVTDRVALSKLYELDRPGEYSMHVSLRVPGDGIVTSNTIKVRITAQASSAHNLAH